MNNNFKLITETLLITFIGGIGFQLGRYVAAWLFR